MTEPNHPIDIPPSWERITVSALSGTLLIVGAADTGKSTFARYLYGRLCEYHERVAFIDGDVGQATLGPPTTMTLVLNEPGQCVFPPAGPRFRAFVGSVSPRAHMIPLLLGAHRLVQKARDMGATAIVFDTTGLVDPAYGGCELKWAKVDLLRPSVVFGLQRRSELEYLLLPLRLSRRVRVIDLPVSQAVQRRDVPTRQEHRANSFRRYFEGAKAVELNWRNLAVFPVPIFTPLRLVALEDSAGFTLGLGIVMTSDRVSGTVSLYTPLTSLEGVNALRLGNITIDPHTFRDTRLL
ncbi:MAG: Clp1/GlmU family protein [Anaerolineae bacterium]|nr:Clp1/GlmU family protein [Anaerolineae bacterium]